MAISPTCTLCGEELDEPGAILLGPPNKFDNVKKRHICTRCFDSVMNIFNDLRHRIDEKRKEVQRTASSGVASHS